MLDTELIDKNCQQASSAVDNLYPTLSSNLFLVSEIFDPAILDKLQDYIRAQDDAAWTTVLGQEHLPRHKITWDMDSVIEELHVVCESLTDKLSARFDRDLRFNGIQIWRDREGYYFGYHTDDPAIDTSLQVYLFEGPANCGTTFFNDGSRYVITFYHNTGYLCTSHQVPHETTTPVPPGVTRYSLYAHWCRAH